MHAARQKTTSGAASFAAKSGPALVGTIHDPASLRAARRPTLDRLDADVFEVRLDRIVPPASAWEALLRRPVILTARHPAEGGPAGLRAAERRELLRAFLQEADAVDIELRSLPGFRDVADFAAQFGAACIVSFHDFKTTPPLERLREVAGRAANEGADLVKIATTTNTPAELARLLSFAAEPQAVPLACMGMGALGRISRLVLANLGTALVYCSLAGANATGQWPVRDFRAALKMVPPVVPLAPERSST